MDNKSTQETLVSHEEQIDFVARKMIEHDEQFRLMREEMATKKDIRGISSTLDKIVGLVEKRDQEMTMLTHANKRQQKEIEIINEDITQMKPALGLS